MSKIKRILSNVFPVSLRTFHDRMNELLIRIDALRSDVAYGVGDTFIHPDAPMAKLVGKDTWLEYLTENYNVKGKKILEIGSRNVTGINLRSSFSKADYLGFDYYAGENVDIVGDAHKLSSYFDKDEKFDLIFSTAVFEHLAMPWLVAIEISKLLNIGGGVFVETHFSYSLHETPWHFFQFSHMALRTLFSPALGFKCIEAGYSNQMIGRFLTHPQEPPIHGLYCHVAYMGEKVKDIVDFTWDKVNLADVVENTKYPPKE